MQAGAHRGPGFQPPRVVHVDVLRQVGAGGGLAQRHQVQGQQRAAHRPGRGGAQRALEELQQVVQRAHHRQRAAGADQRAHQPVAPGPRHAAHGRLDAQLERLQVHDVEQPQIGQRGRQKGVPHHVGIRDADVLDHQEGGRAHHRRHDLAVDRAHGLDGAGLDAAVARLLHHRDGEDAARHHVGHRRAGDHAVERRRHHRHLGRAAAQVAQGGKADLHHVVAAAGAVQQGAEQHVDEDGAGRHAQRDAVHAFGGQPHVRQQARQRRALVRQHLGHPGAGHAVDQKQRRQRRHRPADGAARGLQQQQQAGAGGDDIHGVGLPRPRGQLAVEQHQVGAGKGPGDGQHPVEQRHVAARRTAEGRPGQKGQRQRERQVDGARLGVVEDAEAQHEGQRRRIPELEQRPGQRQAKDQPRREAAGLAPAGVGFGDQLLQRLGCFLDVGGHDVRSIDYDFCSCSRST